MDIGLQLLSTAVLATAEICAKPMEGGVGEPQFCRLAANREISTPYFTITVESEFLVGVHNQGRRLQIQSSIRQSQDILINERGDGSSPPNWPNCPAIAETVREGVTWRDCRISTGDSHERRLMAVLKDGWVLIEYSYTKLGTPSGPALERMTQSIRVHAN